MSLIGRLMLLCSVFLCVACARFPEQPSRQVQQQGCVILLHGLGRSSSSMEPMAKALRAAGYRTVNLDYPSRSGRIEELALTVLPKGIQTCRESGAQHIHFVTHSMGGIVLRWWLEQNTLPELGRVVMLSPPNHGSEVADRLADEAWYRWLVGPAGQELTTGPEGLPSRLGPADYALGIVTGSRSAPWDYLFSLWLPGDDDGKVSVASARLEGMHDLLVVPYSHTFIAGEPEVIRQVMHFLEHGHFDHVR